MADLSQETLRAAVLGALRDKIDGEYQHARGQVLDQMVQARKAGLPIKSIDVLLSDGQKVATVTLVDSTDEVVVRDRAAFTAWVQQRAPEMVTQDPSPLDRVSGIIHAFGGPGHLTAAQAQASRRDIALAVLAELGIDPDAPEPRVSRSYEAALLAELKPLDIDPNAIAEGEASPEDPRKMYDPESGEIVPGVEYLPATDPTKFQMNYKPSSAAGREAIALAWREGRLPAIEGLPEVTS